MPLDFPQTPAFGDIYGQWRWDGNKWTPAPVTGGDAPADGGTYGRFNNTWQRAVNRAGDTMTGLLTLSGAPTNPLHAATKTYVDTQIGTGMAAYLPLAGGTLLGPLLLAANPTDPLGAATKQYADLKLSVAVTSISAGTGIVATPNPIVGTGTVSLAIPVAIASGGTNATTAGAGADNLHGFAGGTAGFVKRTGTATYALDTATYLTGNQTVTLTGAVSGSGTTSIATTLATVPIASGGTGSTTAPAALTALGAVARAGDTMTGDLTISKTWPALFISKPASGTSNQLVGRTGSNNRWTVELGDNSAESSGAGSDLVIRRYNDAGTYLDNPLAISRATGNATFGASVSALNFTLVNQAAGDAGTFGFTNTNGPSVMCWGNTTGNAGALLFTTSGIERMRIANNGTATFSGSAAFSTTVPSDSLIGTVFTGGNFTTIGGGLSGNIYYSNAATWKYVQNGFGVLMASNGAGGWQTYTAASGTAGNVATLVSTLVIDNLGNLQIGGPTATKPGGGSWVAPSDKRLKSSVEPWAAGLAEILKLNPTAYRYTDDRWNLEETDYVGLDAEAAALVIPEMARTFTPPPIVPPDAEPKPAEAPQAYAAIDHGPLTFALINAVKELAAKIDAIEAALPPSIKPEPQQRAIHGRHRP